MSSSVRYQDINTADGVLLQAMLTSDKKYNVLVDPFAAARGLAVAVVTDVIREHIGNLCSIAQPIYDQQEVLRIALGDQKLTSDQQERLKARLEPQFLAFETYCSNRLAFDNRESTELLERILAYLAKSK